MQAFWGEKARPDECLRFRVRSRRAGRGRLHSPPTAQLPSEIKAMNFSLQNPRDIPCEPTPVGPPLSAAVMTLAHCIT